MSKDDISNTKPNGNPKKEQPRKGSMAIMPSAEELRAWNNGEKQAVHKAIQTAHMNLARRVAKHNGQPMYVDKRGNS